MVRKISRSPRNSHSDRAPWSTSWMMGRQTAGSSPSSKSSNPTFCRPIQTLLSTRTTRFFLCLRRSGHRRVCDHRNLRLLTFSRLLPLPLALDPFLAEEPFGVTRPERILQAGEPLKSALDLQLADHLLERAVDRRRVRLLPGPLDRFVQELLVQNDVRAFHAHDFNTWCALL